jgi:hypothetical protein
VGGGIADVNDEVGARVAALCDGYRQAGEEIAKLPDPLERDLGMGTLRLEAIDIWQRVHRSLPAPSEQDLRPLDALVDGLGGGKLSEAAVKGVDAAGRKVLRDVGNSLLGLKLVGSASLLVGAALAYAGFAVELGGNFARALLAGTLATGALVAILRQGGKVVEQSYLWSTSRASSLGSASEAAMAKPREAERKLLAAFALVPPSRHKPLAARARQRAELAVTVFWIGVGAGGAGFLIGAVGVIEQLG